MSTTLLPCPRCARHVRSTDARCPFCGVDVGAVAWGDLTATAGLSRRDVLALGAVLAAAACRSPGGSHETSIVQPYGAPPTPPTPVLPSADADAPSITWSLTATAAELPMSARAQWRLQIAATNQGDATVNPQRHRLSFFVDGRPSAVTDMAFGNGGMVREWLALPPGATVRDARELGESLFTAPGDHEIAMRYLDVEVARLRVRVTPAR